MIYIIYLFLFIVTCQEKTPGRIQKSPDAGPSHMMSPVSLNNKL